MGHRERYIDGTSDVGCKSRNLSELPTLIGTRWRKSWKHQILREEQFYVEGIIEFHFKKYPDSRYLESLKVISQGMPSPVMIRLLTASPAFISHHQRALMACGNSCIWSLDPQCQVQVCFPKLSLWCLPAWKGRWRNAGNILCLLWAQPTALFLCRECVLTVNSSHTCFHFYPPPCC